MSKKTPSQTPGKKLEQDLDTFEQLPEETKEQMNLKKQAEHSTGPKEAVITRKIQDQERKKGS